MSIMGMGWQEIMIVLVGALLIFGPDRLPEVAGQIGKFMRDIRKMTGDLTGELERTAGVGDIKKAVQNELAGVQGSISGATKGVQSTMSGAASSVNKSVTSATTAAKGAAKPATTSNVSAAPKTTSTSTGATAKTAAAAPAPKPVASKKDPLADVSFFEETAPVAAKSDPVPQAATLNGNTKVATSVAAVPADALGRARQRRIEAYARRSS